MNRIISLFLFIFIASCLNAQYNSPIRNKVTLGKQTTADGLVWRGLTSDTANLMTNKLDTSVYLVLDTMTKAMWLYRVTTTPKWNRVVDSLNNMQGILSVANGGTGQTTLAAAGINTGSGTLNYLPKYTATGTTLGNSSIFDNGSGVGIGTESPTSGFQFQVTGTNARFGLFNNSSGNTTNFSQMAFGRGVGASEYAEFYRQNDTKRFNIYNEGGDIFFSTNYVSDYRYDLFIESDNGNVGIGTTSPSAKLEILGNTDSFGGMAKIFFTDSNSNSDSRNWSIGNGGSGYGNLTFSVSTSKDGNPSGDSEINAMVIDKSGNVGIGETIPTARLHVKGVDVTDNNFALKVDDSNNLNLLSVKNNGNVGIGADGSAGYKLDVSGVGRFSTTGNALRIASTSTASNVQLYITNNNNGDVYTGVSASDGTSPFTGTTAYSGYIGTNVNVPFQIASNGAVRLTIASTGAATFSSSVTATQFNVTTGGGGLNLNSGDAILDYSSASVRLRTYKTDVGYITPLLIDSQTGAATFSSSVTATGLIINNNGEALRAYGLSPNVSFYNSVNTVRGGYVNHDGSNMNIVANVGGLSFTGAATFSSSVTAGGYFALTTTSAAYDIQGTLSWNEARGTVLSGKTASTYDVAIYGAAGQALITNPTGTSVISFPTGNVGIGTINPSSKLDVRLDNATTAHFGQNPTTAGFYTGISLGYGNPGVNGYRKSAIVQEQIGDASYARGTIHILNDETADASNATLADARLSILNNGNVGIGTPNPQQKLEVDGKIALTADVSRRALEVDGSNNLLVGGGFNTIYMNGNVGIGTASPNYKLHIKPSSSGRTLHDPRMRMTIESDLEAYYNVNIPSNGAGGFRVHATQDVDGPDAAFEYWVNNNPGNDRPYKRFHFTSSGYFGFNAKDNIERFRIDSTGNIGIGDFSEESPTEKLHVVGNGRFTAVGAGDYANDLNITSTGVLTTASSDEKYKYNILPINYGLNTILQLKPVNFQWIKGEENDLGFIAQDVADIIPEAVDTNWNSDLLMRYESIIPILTKAIQEQQALIKSLEQRILILENK
jgi:hypothetical protein